MVPIPGRGNAAMAAVFGTYDEGVRQGEPLVMPVFVNLPVEVRVRTDPSLPAGVHSAPSGQTAAQGAQLMARRLGHQTAALRLTMRAPAPRAHTIPVDASLLGAVATARALGRPLTTMQLKDVALELGVPMPPRRGLIARHGQGQAVVLGPALELGVWLMTLTSEQAQEEVGPPARDLDADLLAALPYQDQDRILSVCTRLTLSRHPDIAGLWEFLQRQGAAGMIGAAKARLAIAVFASGQAPPPPRLLPRPVASHVRARLTGWQPPN